MKIERTCYACKGVGYFESYTGRIVECLTCYGDKTVMGPDDAECRLMIERVLTGRGLS